MKKSNFLTFALATLALVSCGNKTQTQTSDADSVQIETTDTTATLSADIKPTVDALISNFANSVEQNDANALTKTLADMQVVYKNLVDNGKVDEAKAYAKSVQEYLKSQTDELNAMTNGNSNITSLVQGVINLPSTAEATVEDAKKAVVADVIKMASPTVAKGATIVENTKEAAAKAEKTVEAVKNAPETAKKVAEQAATNVANQAKATAQKKVDDAKAAAQKKVDDAKNKVEEDKAKAKAKAVNKVNEAAEKVNSALDKAKAGFNAGVNNALK